MKFSVGAVAAFALMAQESQARKNGHLSRQMATSMMSRNNGIATANDGVSGPLQYGFTQKAFTALAIQYPNDAKDIRKYIDRSVQSAVSLFEDATSDASKYTLDRLSNGNGLLQLDAQNRTFGKAATALEKSIMLNQRTFEGGLWYYSKYSNWSYLDGMYSYGPFATLYRLSGEKTNDESIHIDSADDVLRQFELLWDHTHDNTTGLLVHGYDASRTASWADPVTGASPIVWSRSLGWYSMALVDVLELMTSSKRKGDAGIARATKCLRAKYRSLARALVAVADSYTGAWWQVVDQPGREGNYIESSGSAMFTYSLLKGARKGFLDGEGEEFEEKVKNTATRSYRYLKNSFLVRETNGTLGYNGTVAVCSLNSTATYEYYVGQPISYNSVLGSSAFVLASLEYERLGLE